MVMPFPLLQLDKPVTYIRFPERYEAAACLFWKLIQRIHNQGRILLVRYTVSHSLPIVQV
ncbi:hypothetical protein HFD99_13860 [Paenibacillus sp. EKM301P]|nr:hypothetical protein HFD99_13860 [Paenibacillus sp. EKM301P]RPE06595.1 hypothetical protein EG487_10980 [Paenibacillus polymyxa]